ncbi:hypothetical protein ACFX13_018598 [Malus domestica]|uniref:Uncharacterized protein n=1 Tax=Malus domestica TaxID=3750 RepID=A0A498HTU2_MALDO|nr:hypothetical protein DVH24_029719 [Malus domestica]
MGSNITPSSRLAKEREGYGEMACIGNQVRPCDLRLHLMKEVSGIPTSLKKDASQRAASPDAMAESSSSGTARLDKADSFRDRML